MSYLIFGGDGFIGNHLAKYIAEQDISAEDIYNFDLNNKSGRSVYLDVRKPVDVSVNTSPESVIFNLAAVHVTPGHADHEYFETNISGAQNICDFAREKDINTIVFTSSIAPYGVSEEVKTEQSLTMPSTPYGISKLVAEYIHKLWQAEQPDRRKLIIIRPGVVFGKCEGGNFTRLYNSLKKGFFFYPGRKDTKKAAVYVKDVTRILFETSVHQPAGTFTFNLTYSPPPSIQEICNTIASVTKVKAPKLVVTPNSLKLAATILFSSGKLFGKNISGIHPDRVKKLMISTNISGEKLSKSRYALQYSLEDAITDWFNDCEQKGLF